MRGPTATAARLLLPAATLAVLLGAPASPASSLTTTATPPGSVEGNALAGTVASFTDGFGLVTCPPASQYAAKVTWGDGTTSAGAVGPGAVMLLGPCVFPVTASHTYSEEGPVRYSVSITAPTGAGDSGPATLTVRDAPLTAASAGFTASQGTPAAATVATFIDANPGAQPADFAATISWGDGSSAAGAVTGGPSGNFAVTASHTYARSGTFTASTTIKDTGGSQDTASASATVLATATGQPQPAPRGPPPAPLRLGLSAPVLARGGTVVVGVRCPVAARLCRGRLNVSTVAAPHSRLVALRRSQTLGATLFLIPGGRRAQLSIRPRRSTVALLRQAGAVKVAAYASSFDAATGRSQVASLTAKLALRRRS